MCVIQEGKIKVSDGTVSRWKVMRSTKIGLIRTYWEHCRVGEPEMESGTRCRVRDGSGFCCFATKKDALAYIKWESNSSAGRFHWNSQKSVIPMLLRKYYIPKGSRYIDGRIKKAYYGSRLPASRARRLVKYARLSKIKNRKVTK